MDLNFRGHPPLLSGNIILLQPLFTSAFLTTTVFFPLLRGHCLPTYYYCKGSKSAPATSAFEDYYARTVATLPLRRLRRRSNGDGSGLRGRLRASKGWQLAEPGTTTASSTQAKRALKKYCPARPRISGLLRSTPWAFAI